MLKSDRTWCCPLLCLSICTIAKRSKTKTGDDLVRKADVFRNSGALPSDIPDTQGQTICKAGAADCTGYVDLSILTTDEEYLVDIPHDPDQECEGTDTCYGIYQSITGRITVEATYAELGADISISR